MELNLKLDLADNNHRKILAYISKVYAAEEVQETELKKVSGSDVVQTVSQPVEAPAKPNLVLVEQQELIPQEPEVSHVSVETNVVRPLAPAGKMDTVSRARLAAQARWERERAAKEGREIPLSQAEKKKLKKKHRKVNIAKAEEQPLSELMEQTDLEGRFSTTVRIPDGRDLLEESWDNVPTEKNELEPDSVDIMAAVDTVQHSYKEAKQSDKY
ncbi:MAG: hypothetical protein ACXVCY_04340 [Pseudobdellovibrionaceae bacterium]